MQTDRDTDHFDEMTDFLSREAKVHVLDSLACVFHNEGYSLQGNTEENDTQWLAGFMARKFDDRNLDRCSEDRQQELLKMADVAIKCLPALADRIASRYVRVSKAIRTVERIARQQCKK